MRGKGRLKQKIRDARAKVLRLEKKLDRLSATLDRLCDQDKARVIDECAHYSLEPNGASFYIGGEVLADYQFAEDHRQNLLIRDRNRTVVCCLTSGDEGRRYIKHVKRLVRVVSSPKDVKVYGRLYTNLREG